MFVHAAGEKKFSHKIKLLNLTNTQAIIVKNEIELRNYLKRNLINDEIIIGMGAGSITKWMAGLKNSL